MRDKLEYYRRLGASGVDFYEDGNLKSIQFFEQNISAMYDELVTGLENQIREEMTSGLDEEARERFKKKAEERMAYWSS